MSKNWYEFTLLLGLLIPSGLAGCATWDESTSEPSELPPMQAAGDSVGLEVGFVRVPVGEETTAAHMWQDADEQHLSPKLRRCLAANGFRCGVLGSHMPEALTRLLQDVDRPPPDEADAAVPVGDGPIVKCRQIHNSPGQRAEVVASRPRAEMAVLRCEEGEIRGETYRQAQCLWAVKTFPLGDGRVRLELTPEVHHGQSRNRWVGEDGVFRLAAGRDRRVLSDLRIEAILAPGQTLMLGGVPDRKGLGGQFFTEPSESGGVRDKLLLVRLAQTRYDDLFAPERIAAPIARATE